MKEVTVTVSQLGDVKIDAEGFVGTECSKATQHIEAALGGKKVDKDPKDAMYASTDLNVGF